MILSQRNSAVTLNFDFIAINAEWKALELIQPDERFRDLHNLS